MAKPASKPDWTSSNPSVRTEPTGGKKNTGWNTDERPAREYMNWLFFNIDEWIDYFETSTDGLLGFNHVYQAIIGASAGCTHATLAAALADVAVVAGSKIFVKDPATITSTITVTKADIDIEFHPLAIYTNSAAGTCIAIAANGVRIRGGKFSGFTTGISIADTKNQCFITENRFASCTNDVTDNNTAPNNVIANNLTE